PEGRQCLRPTPRSAAPPGLPYLSSCSRGFRPWLPTAAPPGLKTMNYSRQRHHEVRIIPPALEHRRLAAVDEIQLQRRVLFQHLQHVDDALRVEIDVDHRAVVLQRHLDLLAPRRRPLGFEL